MKLATKVLAILKRRPVKEFVAKRAPGTQGGVAQVFTLDHFAYQLWKECVFGKSLSPRQFSALLGAAELCVQSALAALPEAGQRVPSVEPDLPFREILLEGGWRALGEQLPALCDVPVQEDCLQADAPIDALLRLPDFIEAVADECLFRAPLPAQGAAVEKVAKNVAEAAMKKFYKLIAARIDSLAPSELTIFESLVATRVKAHSPAPCAKLFEFRRVFFASARLMTGIRDALAALSGAHCGGLGLQNCLAASFSSAAFPPSPPRPALWPAAVPQLPPLPAAVPQPAAAPQSPPQSAAAPQPSPPLAAKSLFCDMDDDGKDSGASTPILMLIIDVDLLSPISPLHGGASSGDSSFGESPGRSPGESSGETPFVESPSNLWSVLWPDSWD